MARNLLHLKDTIDMILEMTADCWVSSFSPKCLPYPRDEREVRIILLMWAITWAMPLVFWLVRTDWREDSKLLIAICRYLIKRLRNRC